MTDFADDLLDLGASLAHAQAMEAELYRPFALTDRLPERPSSPPEPQGKTPDFAELAAHVWRDASGNQALELLSEALFEAGHEHRTVTRETEAQNLVRMGWTRALRQSLSCADDTETGRLIRNALEAYCEQVARYRHGD